MVCNESMQNESFSPGLKAHPNLKVMTTKGMDKTLVQTQALQIRRHSQLYSDPRDFHISSSVTSHSQNESMQNEPFSPGLKAHPNLKVMTTKGMDKTLLQTQALQIRRHST